MWCVAAALSRGSCSVFETRIAFNASTHEQRARRGELRNESESHAISVELKADYEARGQTFGELLTKLAASVRLAGESKRRARTCDENLAAARSQRN